MSTQIFQGSDGHYLLAFNCPLSHMTYDITQSHMVSWGFNGHQDRPFATSDAEAVSNALVEGGLIQQSNLKMCVSERECTTDAIKSTFKSKAGRIGENGVFIFAYHGPTTTTAVHDSIPSLISSDYVASSITTHVTATTILSWLEQLGSKIPKQVLVFLDCDLASEIAKPLTVPLTLNGIEKFCVFCSNTPANTSQLTTTLQCSIFTYFAVWAIKKCTPIPNPDQMIQRLIYINDISDKIKECCVSLNSLCVSERQDVVTVPTVTSVKVQPLCLLQRYDDIRDDGVGIDMVDGVEEQEDDMTDGTIVARFNFLEKFYQFGKKKQKSSKLCDTVYQWLQYLRHGDTSPLHILQRYGFLTSNIMLLTLFRLLMYSLVLIQEFNEQNSTADPNTFIMIYVQAASVLEHVATTEVGVSYDHFQQAYEAYCLALELKKVSSSKISELAKKVKREKQQ